MTSIRCRLFGHRLRETTIWLGQDRPDPHQVLVCQRRRCLFMQDLIARPEGGTDV